MREKVVRMGDINIADIHSLVNPMACDAQTVAVVPWVLKV